MKILSAEEIRLWDQYTMANEPIASIDLMERAAVRCTEWLMANYPDANSFGIFCGKGNNGGDGLAIARLLLQNNYTVAVHILEFGHKGTDDFQANLARLHQLPQADIHFIQSEAYFHPIPQGQIIIDALLGSGINRKMEGVTAALVTYLNEAGRDIVSIDIPSGMFVDHSSLGNPMIKATHTLTFQNSKPAFLFAENADYTGEVHVVDIGLLPGFLQAIPARFELLDADSIRSLYKPRKAFTHKGNFGHCLLIAGSYGKIGAALLSARACLRSGAGLLTCHIPQCGYGVLQTAVPEAMVTTDFNTSFSTKIETDLAKYDAIGIGPGIGTASETKMMLREILDSYRSPLALDADALNIIASQKDLLQLIPPGSVLTPHPKEFQRLFGETADGFDRMFLAMDKAKELNCTIILKGHYTFIATPYEKGYFNNTGNAGMATAGSGDVLSGMLTGLLAQGYSPVEAALLGVHLHGLAGDLALQRQSQESLIAGDIISFMGEAYKTIAAC